MPGPFLLVVPKKYQKASSTKQSACLVKPAAIGYLLATWRVTARAPPACLNDKCARRLADAFWAEILGRGFARRA
jgi:hypothetical protein